MAWGRERKKKKKGFKASISSLVAFVNCILFGEGKKSCAYRSKPGAVVKLFFGMCSQCLIGLEEKRQIYALERSISKLFCFLKWNFLCWTKYIQQSKNFPVLFASFSSTLAPTSYCSCHVHST